MPDKTKSTQYSIKLLSQIQEMFTDENCENFIDINDFKDDDNTTEFFHALGNLVPCHFYNYFTDTETNLIDFNHIANKLVFQNMEITK